jgi:hypothetical protein
MVARKMTYYREKMRFGLIWIKRFLEQLNLAQVLYFTLMATCGQGQIEFLGTQENRTEMESYLMNLSPVSVLDFFVVCDRVLPYVTSMVVDEAKKCILTKYEQIRKDEKACNTDHATEIMDVNLNVLTEKPVRRELYNLKNREAQESFKQATSETNEFTSCFNNHLPVLNQVENWRKVLKFHCSK